MIAEVKDVLVRKSLVVNAPAAHVFKVFTEGQNTWWPRDHHIGGTTEFTAVMEPKVGGRWFERGDDGSETDWGRVLAWEPPNRLLLRWGIGADWKFDPELDTEIEVLFVAEAQERTRVQLEHRKLYRYGDKAEMMRAMFDSEQAWVATLQAMAKVTEAAWQDARKR